MSGTVCHAVREQVERASGAGTFPGSAARRLAILVSGIIAAKTTVLAKVASEVLTLGLTEATRAESVERGLRRTLSDGRLDARGYAQTLAEVVDWEAYRRSGEPVILALDESSQDDRTHLLRISLTYWGGSVPLAWVVWEQNEPLPQGEYWQQIEAVVRAARALVPADLEVVVTADRAFDVPGFIDRVAAVGWHWGVRAKARSDLRYRDHQGRELALKVLLQRHLSRPGCRWKGRGQVFKAAGWRTASVVGVWARGHKEPLVVLTDLPARWAVLAVYDRRYWIEPGFRTDKTTGWQWEASGVQGIDHQRVLVLAMAWATLVTLCVGVQQAQTRLEQLRLRPRPVRRSGWWGRVVERARHAVFTLGLRAIGCWLYATPPAPWSWSLPDPHACAWNHRWRQAQIARNLAGGTVRP